MNRFEREGFHKVEFDPNKEGANVSDELIMEQVKLNIQRQLPQLYPHQPNKNIVALVCGGPSLAGLEKELAQLSWKSNVKVVTVNGAYQWCIDHNIKPSAMVMLDARKFNARFVETPVEGCKYFLASQCHPDAFDLCKDRDVTMFHCCCGGDIEYNMLKKYYFGYLNPIPIGTTVAVKAIQIFTLLGFKLFDIFGMDSCWMENSHHSYSQPENDRDKYMPVWLTPDERPDLAEQFFCAPWMMRQAQDFQKLVRDRGNNFQLRVRGDGLIAAILRLAATLGSSTVKIDE